MDDKLQMYFPVMSRLHPLMILQCTSHCLTTLDTPCYGTSLFKTCFIQQLEDSITKGFHFKRPNLLYYKISNFENQFFPVLVPIT